MQVSKGQQGACAEPAAQAVFEVKKITGNNTSISQF
jgi:hypothetical protein